MLLELGTRASLLRVSLIRRYSEYMGFNAEPHCFSSNKIHLTRERRMETDNKSCVVRCFWFLCKVVLNAKLDESGLHRRTVERH